MPGISLRPITPDNWVECIELAVTDVQQVAGYISPNVLSLAQAYAVPWWTPVAVYASETTVGFVLYGRWPARAYAEMWGDRPKPGVDYILRMMLDRRYQGQGFGKAVMVAAMKRRSSPSSNSYERHGGMCNSNARRVWRTGEPR